MLHRTSILFVLLLISATAAAQAQTARDRTSFAWFTGTWTCVPSDPKLPKSTWTFLPPDAGKWSRFSYGSGSEIGGNAVVGYLPAIKQWIYDDYHTDGSFSRVTSSGYVDGTWNWGFTYYPPGAGDTVQGHVDWIVRSENAYDAVFYIGAATTAAGSQSCTRTN